MLCVTDVSRDEVLSLGNLVILCLYDWVTVCVALMDRMQMYRYVQCKNKPGPN